MFVTCIPERVADISKTRTLDLSSPLKNTKKLLERRPKVIYASCEERISYLSGAPEFAPGFLVGFVLLNFEFFYVINCSSFRRLSFLILPDLVNFYSTNEF